MKDGRPKAIHLKDYEAPNYLVETTELRFDLDEEATTVTSKLKVRRNPQGSGSSELTLDGSDLELLDVSIDGRALAGNEYRLEDETLTLFDVAEEAVIACTTRIDPKANTALEGLYLSGPMFCTQCEAEGFRRITFYPDRPDVMSRFTTTIVADDKRYPVMLSNGNEVARERADDGRLSVTWEDPFPKPAYLFALVAGDLAMIEDQFTTMSGREVTLRIFSESHNIGKCGYAMESLKRAMRWDEEVYGREYDLDIFMIVAVDTFNMGAMENKGLNVFNTSCVLADPKTTTDQGFKRVEAVVAHEYFHNWSGNRVTCRDWFQLSLKEGFTVFRDGEFSSDMGSRTVKRIEDVNHLRVAQFLEDGGPMAHPVRPDSYIEISNFYTLTVYEKGAEVVRMIHTLLGPERFRRGTDLYFERHDGEAVTTDDFVAAMEDANEFDLGQFRRWYAQAGTPVVRVEREYDEKTRTLSLTLEQSCPPTPGQATKEALHIPFALGLLSGDGREMLGASGRDNGFEVGIATQTQVDNPRGDGTLVLHLKDTTQHIAFNGVDADARVSLLRGFSAPVRLEAERSADELRFLMLHDADGFARWDAGQEYYLRVLRAAVQDIQAGGTVTLDEGLVETFRGLLDRALEAADDGEEKAMLAAMLSLPSEAYVGETFDVIDVDVIHEAREIYRRELTKWSARELEYVYRENQDVGAYSPDAPGIARRSLKNSVLGYLTLQEDPTGVRLCIAQFRKGNNMTDVYAALVNLVSCEHPAAEPARVEALDHFYEKWQHEALVVDQWFAAQASSQRPGTLDRVKVLKSHPAFDIGNPNKVRAMIGAFGRNPIHFHAKDGRGYEFLTDEVIALNGINPQMAAAMLTPLTHWRRYDAHRQETMKRCLERLRSEKKLSKDVFEVVEKSLAS